MPGLPAPFQNPRLNADGLEFYYRDFYDGLGEERLGNVFAGPHEDVPRPRGAAAAAAAAPAKWLDVGTGHGHFCEVARTVFPDTAFDGLDFTDGRRTGRAARAGSTAATGAASPNWPGARRAATTW